MKNRFLSLIVAGLGLFLSGCGGLKNLHQVDADPATGYSLYRSGQPEGEKDAQEMCDLGIRKVFALNAGAWKYAADFERICGGKVLYNEMQNPDAIIPVDFLDSFDKAVADAKAKGEGILFHCTCGCHRTGRLAAWYRLKFQGWDAEHAINEMNDVGEDMDEHPTLPPQIRAMQDMLLGRACTQPGPFCFSTGPLPQAVAQASPNSNP
jgi:hypothetical protein